MTSNVRIGRIRPWAGVAVAIVGVGLGAVVGAPRARPRAAGQSAESAPEQRAAQADTTARASRDRSGKSRPHSLSAGDLPEPYGEAVSSDEQLARARANARANARIVDLETRFTNESADARWAPPFSAHLRALLDEEGIDPATIRRVDCRATLCRVELDVKAGVPVAGLLAVSAQLETQYWVRPAAVPAAALDVFVARPGLQDSDFGAPGI